MLIRTTKPEKGNKYYNTVRNGGWSTAITGKPKDKDCDVLSNCVGYAVGRFNEIGEYNCCLFIKPVTAKKLIEANPEFEVGLIPKVGSIMVWDSVNGSGHCAIVERVINNNEIITSESFYHGVPFINIKRRKEDGNWGQRNKQKFMGFIYNPADNPLNVDESEINYIEPKDLHKYKRSEHNGFRH